MPVYWIWFANLKGLSLQAKQQLLQTFADVEEIFRSDGKRLPGEVAEALEDKDLTEAKEIVARCGREGIRILTFRDADYPEKLRNVEDPPLVLYCRGTLPDWKAQPLIAVVGTRKASAYGLQTARLMAAHIAVCGGLVVSGAAFGVDSAAMEGALDAGCRTVGVLGGGVDVVYPASNRGLYRRTEEAGCLISEYPPGHRPYPWNFLERNRIISGISDGVLVVEAPAKSGALNTARHAYSQGRDMFAVPGNVGVQTCQGSNALLQEGAFAALSGWDVVKHYAPLYPAAVENRPAPVLDREEMPEETRTASRQKAQKKEAPAKNAIDNSPKSTYSVINKRPQNLSDQEVAVLDLLGPEPQLTDSILDAAGLPSGTVQSVLTRLAIKGLVQQYPDGRISRK